MRSSALNLIYGALLAAGALGCATKPETVYDRTMAEVDKGGQTLYYNETIPLRPMVREMTGTAGVLLKTYLKDPMQLMIADGVVDGVAKLVDELNPDAVKAQAFSVKLNPEYSVDGMTVYDIKQFAYTGDVPEPSLLLEMAGKGNVPFRHVGMLAEDTALAAGVRWSPSIFYAGVKSVAKKLKNPQAAILFDMAELKFEETTGLKLADFVATLDGEFLFSLAVERVGENGAMPHLLFAVPDTNGSLRKLLLSGEMPFVKESDDVYNLPLPPMPLAWRVQLRFSGDCVMLSTDPARFKPEKPLVGSEAWRPFVAGLPRDGVGYVAFNFSPYMLNIVNTVSPENEGACGVASILGSLVPPMRAFGVGFHAADGLKGEGRSDFRVDPEWQSKLRDIQSGIVLLGMQLPALNQARENARRISCASNLKQIGLALKVYANDNPESKFPDGDGVGGFMVLNDQGFLTLGCIYHCPSGDSDAEVDANNLETTCDYIYLGDGLKDDAAIVDMPMVIEKPGHHGKSVNILFGGGHCMGYNLPEEYTDPQQVIDYLKGSINAEQYELLTGKLKALKK